MSSLGKLRTHRGGVCCVACLLARCRGRNGAPRVIRLALDPLRAADGDAVTVTHQKRRKNIRRNGSK